MEIKVLLTILAGTVFINNFVLSQMIGICPFIGVTKKTGSALAMGYAVTFVMTVSSLITFLLYKYVLLTFGIAYLKTLIFILVIALIVQFVEYFIERVYPALHSSLGIYVPLITTNCAVLGVAVLNINSGFISSEYGPVKSIVQGFGGGAGFTLALLLMSGIRERLELSDIPVNLKGIPITFITAGILALAFIGFTGLRM